MQVLDLSDALSWVCLDVANGYSESFVDCVRRTRERFPKHTILAGTACESCNLMPAYGCYCGMPHVPPLVPSHPRVQACRELAADQSAWSYVAGNVVTQEMTEELILSGADAG